MMVIGDDNTVTEPVGGGRRDMFKALRRRRRRFCTGQ
jgi:hypothetical protein